jgi:hypothetical protein
MEKKRRFYRYFTSLSLSEQMEDGAPLKVHDQNIDTTRDYKILAHEI